jgi:alanyl-tRNA synthetase
MTERLYYNDAYLSEFEATILDVVPVGDGRTAVILDRSAFYPTSGGQPFDTGTLDGIRVVDVIDREDDEVLHVVDKAIARGRTLGRIDWPRRFEHMQQHTGQHVLSAAFERACGARTVSFHLGTAAATIDLAEEVSPAQIAAAELAANEVVWEDRPVSVRFIDESEAANLPLRKEPKRSGRLRIVEVESFDLSACGGTHVSRTGAIGNISVGSSERFRGGTRVEFRCGIRTLQSYRVLRDTAAAAARLLSSGVDEVAAGIERLQAENQETRRGLKHLHERLAKYEAAALAERPDNRTASAVVEALAGWDPNGLKTIAAAIAERPGYVAILVTTVEPIGVVVARAADRSFDAGAAVKALTARFGGRGGGRPELAQGGGLNAPALEIVDFARRLLTPNVTPNSNF